MTNSVASHDDWLYRIRLWCNISGNRHWDDNCYWILIADQDVAKMDGSGGGALSAEVKIPFGGCIPYIALFLDPNLSKLPKPRMRMGHRKSIHDAMSQHNSSKYPHVLPKHITQNPHFTPIIFIIQLLSPTSLHSPQLFHNYSTYPQYLPNQSIPTFAPTVVPHGATNPPPAPAALPFPPRCFAGPGASGVYIKERLQEPIFKYFYWRYLTCAI